MPFKYNIEYVREYASKNGFTCLSDKYVSSNTVMEFECKNKHKFLMPFSRILRGTRCSDCSKSKKLTLEHIKEYTEKEGFQCISDNYVNIKSKLMFKCPKQHIFYMDFDHFKRGKRCAECAGNKKHNIDFVKEYTKEHGYECLDNGYVNGGYKVNLICPVGHSCAISFNNFYNHGRRCGTCFGNEKYTIEYVKDFVKKSGYVCHDGYYKSVKSKLHLSCPKKHKHFTTFESFKSGHRCRACFNYMTEKTIRYILENALMCELISIRHHEIRNTKTNRPLELDGFNKDINFAFEYQGLQHYVDIERFGSGLQLQIERDLLKAKRCNELGIKLLIIPTIPVFLNEKDVKLFLTDELKRLNVNIVNDLLDFKSARDEVVQKENGYLNVKQDTDNC